jgi:hypothetical protein
LLFASPPWRKNHEIPLREVIAEGVLIDPRKSEKTVEVEVFEVAAEQKRRDG